jgi:hypothetical protein
MPGANWANAAKAVFWAISGAVTALVAVIAAATNASHGGAALVRSLNALYATFPSQMEINVEFRSYVKLFDSRQELERVCIDHSTVYGAGAAISKTVHSQEYFLNTLTLEMNYNSPAPGRFVLLDHEHDPKTNILCAIVKAEGSKEIYNYSGFLRVFGRARIDNF